jgi:MATE family multidrug resistance protein
MGFTFVPMIITIIAIIFHITLCHILVTFYGFEIIGLAIATSLTYFISFVSITIYTSLMTEIKEAWFLPNKQTFNGLWEFMVVGIPSVTLQCFEWWAFEVILLFSGFISVEAAAA